MTTATANVAATETDREHVAEELLTEIQLKQQEVDELKKKSDEAKEKAKDAKDRWELAVGEQAILIRQSKEGMGPLFTNKNGASNGKAKVNVHVRPVEDTSWRNVPLTEALQGIKAAVIAKLAEADLRTVGELQDFVNAKGKEGYTDPLTLIKGIGAATAEKISQALAEFMARWRAAHPQPEDAPAEPSATKGRKTIKTAEDLRASVAAIEANGTPRLGYQAEGDVVDAEFSVQPEVLFSKEVAFVDGGPRGQLCRLVVTRTDDGVIEFIRGRPAEGCNFGTGWAEQSADRWPPIAEVEAAVSEAIGFAVEVDECQVTDGVVEIVFVRGD